MSLDPILWALKDAPVADSLERLVLVTLAERAARADGCTAFPSRDTIAETVLADPKTVQRILQRLVKRGLIAKGDQTAARYLRADRRPVVYDLLIPYSWFPNPQRMNEERRQAGLAPLTPADRPEIVSPPDRKRRSDVGKTRTKSTAPERGDSQSPREEGHGGTTSPARGDCESRTGGLTDPRYSPMNHPEEPPLPPSPPFEPAPTAPQPHGREGGRELTPEQQQAADTLARITESEPRLTIGELELARLAPLVVPWLERTTPEQLRAALTAGLPAQIGSPAGLLRRRLAEKLPPARPAEPVRPTLPAWCGKCASGWEAAKYNPRHRLIAGTPCLDCHPDTVSARAA